ncbi:MAG: tRNA (adenosine(37)-N6)-threonylcarbamoyltransferase complex transferase subunit TsaD [Desulfovibrionaceae bacterium]|nr:tRNA (adenosine(37)-N6)-threonylcarbamoyltransferase complex transferase subunit TsaD [Desulfovibrionaceae bacterium]
MLVLGIESSCDETGLALVRDGVLVDAVLASQADVHALFGGVVPELASREHLRFMGPLYDQLMARQGLSASDLDAVAVARGPGLLGCLLVGSAFAKGLCLASGAKLVGVNHLLAHLLAAGLEQELVFPALGLLVSGGHTNIYLFESATEVAQLGRTLDDAAGEAFDKCGKVLGLAYPGGKMLDALARRGHADRHLVPRPYLDNQNLDFSFSGLKTAVALHAAAHFGPHDWPRPLTDPADAPQALCDTCASFNLAVAETLEAKVRRALDRHPQVRHLMAAGGVAANSLIRERLTALMAGRGGAVFMPHPSRCTDNAAMIAYAGWLFAREGRCHDLSLEAVPRGRPIPDDWVGSPVRT